VRNLLERRFGSAQPKKYLQGRQKTRCKMIPRDYVVVKIEGEYAYLREIGKTEEDDIFIALALLPVGTDIGTKLHYEMLEYTITE
jgi:hypothetical protein